MRVRGQHNGRTCYKYDSGNYFGQWVYSGSEKDFFERRDAYNAFKAAGDFEAKAWAKAFQAHPRELVPIAAWPDLDAQVANPTNGIPVLQTGI